jgi:hypothetical protein
VNKQDVLRVASWLRQAKDEGIAQAYSRYVKSDRSMCALSAIHAEATGIVPFSWDNDDVSNAQIVAQISVATGVDFNEKLPGHRLSLYFDLMIYNDNKMLTFLGIAEELEQAVE